MVPELGSQQQVLVLKIFHLTEEGGRQGRGKEDHHSQTPALTQTPLVKGQR